MFRYIIDGYTLQDEQSITNALKKYNPLVKVRKNKVTISFVSDSLMSCEEVKNIVITVGIKPIHITASEIAYNKKLSNNDMVEKLIILFNMLSGYDPNERVIKIVYMCEYRETGLKVS